MAIYICPVCSYEYDEYCESHKWDELPNDWACPVCGVEKSMFEKNESEQEGASGNDLEDCLKMAKIPLDKDVEVETRTIIGKNAKRPMVLETPVFVSHMSFGALSKEFKIALAKGSAMAKTAICSGEGDILSEESVVFIGGRLGL